MLSVKKVKGKYFKIKGNNMILKSVNVLFRLTCLVFVVKTKKK